MHERDVRRTIRIMPKRKKLTDADVKKVESVILSDTDVEKADRSKYGVARRSIWYILRFVLIASVVVTLCYAALMEAMYVSNIYIIVTEGMEMRADCILGNKSKAELTEHFTESWLQEDEAVNGNKYSLYRVDSYDHRLEIEKFRVWPWSKEATLQVVERVPNIQATPYSSDTTDPVPSWVACRYEITVDKFDGRWYISRLTVVDVDPPEEPHATPDYSKLETDIPHY